VTEDELAAEIITLCRRHGLLVHHCRDSRRCQGTPGLPDLMIVSRNGILLAELKGRDGDTSADQDAWLYTLHQARVPYAVWRPQDWEAGTIQNYLACIASALASYGAFSPPISRRCKLARVKLRRRANRPGLACQGNARA
jgi:hypothetical protein